MQLQCEAESDRELTMQSTGDLVLQVEGSRPTPFCVEAQPELAPAKRFPYPRESQWTEQV